MIAYALKNSAGTLFNLNSLTISQPAQGSLTYDQDSFEFENKVVQKSALPGSVQLGKRRLKDREISFTFNRALGDDSDTFRTAENLLGKFLQDTVYLVETDGEVSPTQLKQIPISVMGYDIKYDTGAHKLSSDNELSLKLLEPFWSNITADTDSDSLITGINDIAISNTGAYEVPPIIELVATDAVTQIQMFIVETSEGIQINDALFGTPGYTTMDIDCYNGTIMIGVYDRISSLLPGTGFFNFPIGDSTLRVILTDAADISIEWDRRFLI